MNRICIITRMIEMIFYQHLIKKRKDIEGLRPGRVNLGLEVVPEAPLKLLPLALTFFWLNLYIYYLEIIYFGSGFFLLQYPIFHSLESAYVM